MTRIYCNTFLEFNYKHVTKQRHFFCTMVHITVATKSMTHTVFYCSNTRNLDSTHTQGTDICLRISMSALPSAERYFAMILFFIQDGLPDVHKQDPGTHATWGLGLH
jgi:hypothetical protein